MAHLRRQQRIRYLHYMPVKFSQNVRSPKADLDDRTRNIAKLDGITNLKFATR